MRIVTFFALWFLAATPAHAAAGIDFGRYHALVIGINTYEHLKDLESAVNDATAVAELLERKYGFAVMLRLNPTRAKILDDINRLRAELTEQDRLLVYYAGHGVLDRQTSTGYWLPSDAEEDIDTNWIANDTLSRHFKAMSARHVMVVADSCYSGALLRNATSSPPAGLEQDKWAQRMTSKRSRTALVSGGLEPVLDRGRGGHSVFANAFLQALEQNSSVLGGHDLAQRLTRQVVLNADQTPEYSDIRKADHEGGDFVFVPTSIRSVPTAQGISKGASASLAPSRKSIELTFWRSIQNSDDVPEYEAYLARYPNGLFASLARVRIEALRSKKPAAIAPVLNDCDTYAASPYDNQRVALGVPLGQIETQKALAACKRAVEEYPDIVRFSFQYGRAQHTTKDYTQAVHWYRKAAEQNHAGAQNNLGSRYERGEGVARDYAEAMRWFRKAAEQGLAQAQFNIGLMYSKGQGVAKDDVEAVHWYRKAAEQNFVRAQNVLGTRYERGVGVAKDYAEAMRWYRKAAEQGLAVAQFNIGVMFRKGRGVAKDDAEAVNWYRKAANQNFSVGQYYLGEMYWSGSGVTKNRDEAKRWWRKAAAQGFQEAKDRLSKLDD